MISAYSKTKPIKIVHVLHSFDVGGLENGVVNLINHLDWEKYNHIICCVTKSGRLADRIKRKDVEIIEMGKTAGRDLSLPFRLAGLFRRVKPDLVHTRNWGTIDGIVGGWLSHVPFMVHGEHGRTMLEINGTNHRRKIIRQLLSPLVDYFITVSQELCGWLKNCIGIDEHKIITIYNGVDLNKFRAVPDKNIVRDQLGLQQGEFLIGTVGRLDPVKDHASLIHALANLIPKYPALKVLVVGNGPCDGQLRELTRMLGLSNHVIFLGERENVLPILQSIDIFVLPSISEGMSNTILEAMAVGLPVIATRVGGNPELVIDCGTGILIPSQDVSAMSGAIQFYLMQPSMIYQHGVAARRRVEQEFSLDKMVRAYDRFYTGLALCEGNPLLHRI